jgi:hypothetical protein
MVIATRLLQHSYCDMVACSKLATLDVILSLLLLGAGFCRRVGVARPMLKSKNATVFNRSEIVRFGDDGYSDTFNQLG